MTPCANTTENCYSSPYLYAPCPGGAKIVLRHVCGRVDLQAPVLGYKLVT